MTVRSDFYQIVLRFPRLFPDPAVFEDPIHLANRYLMGNGIPREKADLVHQTTDEIVPVDDRGNPSTASGTAKYPFEGRTILAEYMINANIRLDYADFGTGLTPDDHSRLWTKGKLGGLRFELRDFKHQSQTLTIPDVSELYRMLKERATPNTLSTIELDNVPERMFRAGLAYIEGRLRVDAKADGLEVEVYAGSDLSASEKAGLERRLTRESSKSTM
ncbi:hypothetical protein E6H26_03595 [Candidatus Bathyarchaeota archaeon]|nr:MAG: hypothetical protein E6H26_03595 [Candidatus Bathyarchaeota archaeon]